MHILDISHNKVDNIDRIWQFEKLNYFCVEGNQMQVGSRVEQVEVVTQHQAGELSNFKGYLWEGERYKYNNQIDK